MICRAISKNQPRARVRKKANCRPATKALYQPGPGSKFTSAYAASLADYLKRPVMENVDMSDYKGNSGDVSIVKATDIAGTLIVAVLVFGVDGRLIEPGNAVNNVFTDKYVFTAKQLNACVKESGLLVIVRDKSGNITVQSFALNTSLTGLT